MDKKENNRELRILIIGETVVAALTVVGAFSVSLLSQLEFGPPVICGALLGALVVILNFAFLSLSVNRAVDEYLAVRGSREMTEEEADRFTAENSMVIQNKIKTSFIIRTATMLIALVIAFLTGWFDPLCTAIPMLAFKPILTVGEGLRRKSDPAPDPNKFVKYEENTEEKESDE